MTCLLFLSSVCLFQQHFEKEDPLQLLNWLGKIYLLKLICFMCVLISVFLILLHFTDLSLPAQYHTVLITMARIARRSN